MRSELSLVFQTADHNRKLSLGLGNEISGKPMIESDKGETFNAPDKEDTRSQRG